MKKLALVLLILSHMSVFASPVVYNQNGRFGLKDDNGTIITEAVYKKLIKLGETGWIVQSGTKFGVMKDDGHIVVQPKYIYADRILGKFVKLGNGSKYGLFDEDGFEILPVEFSSIDLLFGGMFLTCKNYKYGVVDFNGQPLLSNIFDDIYMPSPNLMVIEYNGQIFEIKRESTDSTDIFLPINALAIEDDSNFTVTEIFSKPALKTGYYSVSATNYALKVFSSISPAYEQTIDELMFSHGADAANVIMQCTWIPKFPIVYAKHYYRALVAPNNGPLQGVKASLKSRL